MTGIYDASDQARNNFWAWLLYETQMNRWDTYRAGFDTIYSDGVSMCGLLALPNAQHKAVIYSRMSLPHTYNETEATAIHMAAVRALCPHRMAGTLPTAFDRNVEAAFGQLQSYRMADGSVLNRFDVGWAGKFSCWYLDSYVPAGLEAFLRQNSATVRVADPRVDVRIMKEVVRAAVGQQCIPHMGKVTQSW